MNASIPAHPSPHPLISPHPRQHMDEQQQLYTFRRPDGGALDCGFADGDLVLLSVDAQHVAVARGTFYTSNSHQLTVSLNRPLRAGLRWPHGPPADAAAAAASGDAAVRWRLDRDEVASTFTRLRGNLFALFRWVGPGGLCGCLGLPA